MPQPSALEQMKKGVELLTALLGEETGMDNIHIKTKGSPRDFYISLEFYVGEQFITKEKCKTEDLCYGSQDEASSQYRALEEYAGRIAEIIIEKTT